ncbi:M23 family metallopeptidase [Synechocystis salina LEGE 06155]|nr:M23 family metallopeptidase [Synechocystis salina LEGE 06155]
MNSFWGTCRQKHCLSGELPKLLGQKRRRRPLIFLLALVLASSAFTIGLASNNRATAQYAPVATSSSNPWQYASFPVENFQQYTSGFGPRRAPTAGASTFHNGLDLAAPLGSYIRNWWHGTVVEMSDHTGCGTMVRIQSGAWQHTYCHLMGRVEVHQGQRYLVDRQGGIVLQQGQQVVAGMRIGRVGMTGRTTGPHLHWELRHNGVLVDPALVLQAMYGGAT